MRKLISHHLGRMADNLLTSGIWSAVIIGLKLDVDATMVVTLITSAFIAMIASIILEPAQS